MGITGTASGSRKKDRKKKPDELLSSVIRETAIPAAVELLRANTRFVFPSGTATVMLVLGADAIGGLSKRHGRDETKGSIIELIGSDQIKTVATAEMLNEEHFGIIPDEETLSRMEEYSLLTGAEYSWAVAWQKPSGDLLVDLVAPATFAQAKAVSAGSTGLREAVGIKAWVEHSGVAEDEVAVDDAGAPTEETPVVGADGTDRYDEGDEIFDPIPGDEGSSDDGGADGPVFDDVADEDEGGDAPVFNDEAPAYEADEPGFDEAGDYEAVAEESEEPEDADEVLLADQDQVREVIARRFLSEDLDLDVRLEEFNATFAIGAPVVQIDVPQGATEWLGDQVAQLNRQTNADLAQLRYAHEDELRLLYVNLMSAHVEQVIRDVATDRDGSRYKALKEGSEQAHLERQSEKEQKIRTRKAEIVKSHEEQAKRLAEQAAIQAEIQYKERNRPKVEREQSDAVSEIERILENAHTHDQQEILRVRRSDAALKMQIGTTRIFEVLAERQSDYLADEEERLGQWKAEIQRIVDDNRQADITQANALAEQQRTTDEIGDLRREQDSLLESVRGEHSDRIRRMEDELERSRKDAVTQMQARDEEWQHSLNLEKERTNSQATRVSDLLGQLETAESSVERRYTARLEEMQADKESYADELTRASEVQSRSNKILVVLMIALSMLSGVAGFIGGAGWIG